MGPTFNVNAQQELPGLGICPRKAAEQMEVVIFRRELDSTQSVKTCTHMHEI